MLARATRCPECGERACSLAVRSLDSAKMNLTYCAHCGCPCKTPPPVFVAALIGGGFVECVAALLDWLPVGRGAILPFFLGSTVFDALLLWLIPFRRVPGEAKNVWGKADVKKGYPYPTERVFRAARDYYGSAYGFEIEGADEERFILWVRQEKVKYLVEENEEKWECFCLSVTEAGPDRCEVRVSLGDEDSWDYNQRQAVKLSEICLKIENQMKVS